MKRIDRWLSKFIVSRKFTQTEIMNAASLVAEASIILQVVPKNVAVQSRYHAGRNELLIAVDYCRPLGNRPVEIFNTIVHAQIAHNSVVHMLACVVPDRMRVAFAIFV